MRAEADAYAALFAILRYLNRTHDVRRFHGA